MSAYPAALSRLEQGRLLIEWSDGERRKYTPRLLRDACPCATCREKRTEKTSDPMSLPILTTGQLQPLQIAGMTPIGNYAYTIAFSDGHDTGIYTFELLKQLGERVAPAD